ncbi:MAG: membrane protein [Chitinophagales bacterium]|nr:MAG: membrane protein [Chitinophagales bacterium]
MKRTLLHHLLVILGFAAFSYLYFWPLVEGKKMAQHDMIQAYCMQGELNKYLEMDGRERLWTNAMFSGMPAYQIRVGYPKNVFTVILQAIRWLFIEEVHLMFLLLAGTYIALYVLTANIWVSVIAAFGFALASFNIISIDAGHITKVRAIALIAPCLAAVITAFNGRMIAGASLLAFCLGLQIRFNHPQITYYTLLVAGVFVVFLFIRNITQGSWAVTLKSSGLLVGAILLAISSNLTQILTTREYARETIRGDESELTSKRQETPRGGLDKDYAFSWSYGVAESFTLIVPYFMGGASSEPLGDDSNLARRGVPKRNLAAIPTYWGDQPFTAGPTYFGIIMVFLFLFGMFLIKEPLLRWMFLAAALLTLMLSWGKNFMFLSQLFFDYVPLYNKFRTPSMILSVTNSIVVLTGGIALARLVSGSFERSEVLRALKFGAGSLGGLLLLLIVFAPVFFDFSGPIDARLRENGWPVDALIKDRIALMRNDAFRSLVFLTLAAGAIFLWATEKFKTWQTMVLLGSLILADQWWVSHRYLNADDYISRQEYNRYFSPSQADRMILQDTTYYRVLDLSSGDPFRSAEASRFHKSIGGYHAAKLRRYQELIEEQILPNIYNLSKGFTNEYIPVLNMLNTKYIITQDQSVRVNPHALGNAWFVKEIKIVPDADEEMRALSSFDPAATAVVNARFQERAGNLRITYDSAAVIRLTSYDPDRLTYVSEASSGQFAVFSEIYYNDHKGWYAYIDGKEVPYVRVNYVLRGMYIPPGRHTIEFVFKPKSYELGEKVSLASGILLLVLVGAGWFYTFRKPEG